LGGKKYIISGRNSIRIEMASRTLDGLSFFCYCFEMISLFKKEGGGSDGSGGSGEGGGGEGGGGGG
jgi:hypothetical protein